MANPGYVRSTDGNDADDGSTWALANATVAGAAADDAAGDTIYFSQNHSEAGSATITVAFGTNASPTKLICANDAAEPPTASATTAVIATGSGAYPIAINGSFYAYGLTIKPGSGAASNAPIQIAYTAGDTQTWEACFFDVNSSGTGSSVVIGNNLNQQCSEVEWRSCNVNFLSTNNYMAIRQARFRWRGGEFVSGTASPSSGLIALNSTGEGADIEITGVNLANLSSSVDLIRSSISQSGTVTFRNCKLPASWSGNLYAGGAEVGLRARMINCTAASGENYGLWVEDFAGSQKHETSIVKTGGASDGTTPISWKITTSANAEYPAIVFQSSEITKWNETTGSSITVTVDIVHDGATALKDGEIWLELEYLGTASYPLSLFDDDATSDPITGLGGGTTQDTSTASWPNATGTGANGSSTWNTLKLVKSITPNVKGLIIARVCMAKTSYTVYVDPELQVS